MFAQQLKVRLLGVTSTHDIIIMKPLLKIASNVSHLRHGVFICLPTVHQTTSLPTKCMPNDDDQSQLPIVQYLRLFQRSSIDG